MMKPAKKKPIKQPKEKVDFKLELHVSKVPVRGWDKLAVSLVAVETGKVAAKTGKAAVKNGSCAWAEPLYETAFISQEANGKSSSKELYKLVVSMGFSRLGILGEATINVAEFTQAFVPVPLSLPLQNCNFGSILHVRIQRIIPETVNNRTMPLEEVHHPAALNGGLQDSVESAHWQESADKSTVAGKEDWIPARNSTDSVDIPPTPGGSESRFHSREGMADDVMSPSSSISSCQESNSFHYYIGANRAEINRSLPNDDSRELGELESNARELTEENTSLISQLKQANEKAMAQDVRIAELEDMIVQLQLKISDSNESGKTNVMMLQQTVDEMRERLKDCEESYENKLASSRTFIDDLNSSVMILRTKNARLESEMQSLDQYSSDLMTEIEALKLENNEQKMEIQRFQQESLDLLGKIQSLTSEKDEHEREKILAASQQGQLQREMSSLDQYTSDLLKEMEAVKLENNKQKMEIQSLQQENFDLWNQIESLKSENDKHEKEKVLVASERAQLRKEMQNLDQYTSNLLKEIAALKLERNEHEMEIQRFQQQIFDLMNEIESLKSKNDEYEKEKVWAASQQEQLRTDMQCLDQHASHLLKEMEDLQLENNKQKMEIQSFQQQTLDLWNQVESLKSENDQHEKEKVLIASQQEQLRMEMQNLDQHTSDLLKEIDALKSENDRHRMEILRFQQQTFDLSSEIESLKLKNDEHEKEKALAALQQGQSKELREKVVKDEGEFVEALQRVEVLEAMVREKDDVVAALKRQLGEAQDYALAAEEECKVALQSVTCLKTEKLYIEKERSSLLEERMNSETTIAQLQNLSAILQEKLRMEELKTSELQRHQQQHNAKEKTMKELSNSSDDQILKEFHSLQKQNESLRKQVDSLQKQNAALSQREMELLAQLPLQNALQRELNSVKEEKKELENALSKFNAAAADDNILKKIVTLEMELAEVLESNNMYKRQLQSAFAQQQNVHAAALENLGSVEQVLKDLADLKRKNACLDDELRDMKERYFNMSLQYAEVEAEREELVMTIRALKGARKLAHYKSSNF